MDVGKPTLSGPDYTACGVDRSDSGRVPEANEHERERERESTRATPTQHTPLMYGKQKGEMHLTPTETRVCTSLYIYI